MKLFLYALLAIAFLLGSCKEDKGLPKPVEQNQKLVFSSKNIGQKYHLLSEDEKIRYLSDLVSKEYSNSTELDEWVFNKIEKEPELFEKANTAILKDFAFYLSNNNFSKSSNYTARYFFDKRQDEKFNSLQAIAIKAILDDLQPNFYKDSIKYYLDFYQKALKFDNNPIFFYDFYSKESTYNELNGDIFKAILSLDKALTYLSDKDIKNKSILYNNLSLLYKNLNYYEKAEFYIEKAISVTDESDVQLNTLNSLASIKMRLNKLEESEKVYFKIIEKNKIDNNPRTLAQVYTNLGNVFRRKKEFEKALDYYHKSDSICDTLGIEIGKHINQINRSEVYLDMGQYKESEKTILLALKQAEKFDIPSINVELYKLLSEILAKNNQTALSDKYFRMYIELKDKLSGDQTKSSITEWELAKERENNLAANSEIKLKLEQQKTQIYFISLLFITIVVVAMGVYIFRRKR